MPWDQKVRLGKAALAQARVLSVTPQPVQAAPQPRQPTKQAECASLDPLSVLAGAGMACHREATQYNAAMDRYDAAKQDIDQQMIILKARADLLRMKYPSCSSP